MGASRAQNFVATTFSRALPSIISIVLYRLDINIRSSAVLGLVGAGGIGVALQTAIGSLDYHRALGIILVIVGMLLVLEPVAYIAQRALTEHAGEHRGRALRRGLHARHPGLEPFAHSSSGLGDGRAALFFCLDPAARGRAPNGTVWENTVPVLAGFFPPVFSLDIVYGIFESVIMAISATTFGVIIGW